MSRKTFNTVTFNTSTIVNGVTSTTTFNATYYHLAQYSWLHVCTGTQLCTLKQSHYCIHHRFIIYPPPPPITTSTSIHQYSYKHVRCLFNPGSDACSKEIFATYLLRLICTLTLILTGYEYIFLTDCEPDMCHTLMLHLPGPLIFMEN
jgi:hypothetical protein